MAQKNIAVKVDHIKKTFKIPLEGSNGVKQKIINTLKGRNGYRNFTPLNDISFEIEEGDFFGIVGKNGSGKSTLLKTIAGIYTPDGGSVETNGTLVPFIELGVGFNPELTGRENVYLNGALLGFSRKEMQMMYEEIVEFAELDEFMDERLKNYSSGMQVRLAFSIAIRAQGDVLLLDEVLAVGDEAFQQKCYSYFNQLKRKKKTVILVTHDMSAVERFCNKAILIDNGKIIEKGKPYKIATQYSRLNFQSQSKNEEEKAYPTDINIQLLSSKTGKKVNEFSFDDDLTVRLKWDYDGVNHVGVAIYREDGQYIFGPNTYQDKFKLEGAKTIDYHVKLNLNEGRYFIKAGLAGIDDTDWIAFIDDGPVFSIERDYIHGRWGGVGRMEYKWND